MGTNSYQESFSNYIEADMVNWPREINAGDLLKVTGELIPKQGRELDFFTRVYANGIEQYIKRLKSIGFEGKDAVLDAGAGFGQWTIALSRLNKKVTALEISRSRCRILQKIIHHLGIDNVTVVEGDVENIPLNPAGFDGLFSYSVIYQADWKRALKEFGRLLRPKGVLYIAANGMGWTLYNALSNRNPSKDFSPRRNALKSLIKTLSLGTFYPHCDSVLFPGRVETELERLGFGDINIAGDGMLGIHEGTPISFYKSKRYGLTNVFEILAQWEG